MRSKSLKNAMALICESQSILALWMTEFLVEFEEELKAKGAVGTLIENKVLDVLSVMWALECLERAFLERETVPAREEMS